MNLRIQRKQRRELTRLEKTKRLKKIQEKVARWEQMISISYERLVPGGGGAAAAAAAAPGEEGGSEVRVPGISTLPPAGAPRTPRTSRGNVIGGVYQNNTPIRPQSVSNLSRRRQNRSAGPAIVPAAAGTAADPVILDEEGLEFFKLKLSVF